MPHCYQPNDARRVLPAPATRAAAGLADDALVLCAFHQSYKISAEVFATWCDLLQRLPGSVLWLLQWNANVQQSLTAAARERGIDADRLVFAPVLPLEAHLARLACADLFLDAWPCNAHTTAGEALWVGVPVVTVQGRTFAQRVAASLLHTLGLDELIAADVAAYSALVIALAGDAPRRAALRDELAARRHDDAALRRRRLRARHRGAVPAHVAACRHRPGAGAPAGRAGARRLSARQPGDAGAAVRGRSARRRRARERCGRCAARRRRCRAPAPSPRRRGRRGGRPTGARSAPCRAGTRPARALRA